MERFYLSSHCALRKLETPCVYDMRSDELYELDEEAFALLEKCASPEGAMLEPSDEFSAFCIKACILSPQPQDTRRPGRAGSPVPSLRYLELQITRRCNLSCSHCFLGPAAHIDLAPDVIRRVLEEFEHMQGLRVLITGGEPMLHPRFDEINLMLPEFSLRKVLFTNGLAVTESFLRGLNVDEMQVSVDGVKTGHDALRGKGSFSRAISAIKAASLVGMAFSVSTMVHESNLEEFEEMDRLFRALGAREWSVDIPTPAGNLKNHPEFNLAPELAGPYLRYGFGEACHGGGDGYACGHHLVSVGADGKCAKCSFYFDRPLGHVSEGLRACWARIERIPLGKLECDCKMIEECRGGCRFRAEASGPPLSKDLYKCGFHDIL
jgi:radical SAM protein with 4Fe4S-binding SPASM domain